MSKEAMERILRAEEDARALILKAEKDAEKNFREAEDKISAERAAFYEKLKAERNEKMRRVDLQMRISLEEAQKEAEQAYSETKKVYYRRLDEAIEAAINTVLK